MKLKLLKIIQNKYFIALSLALIFILIRLPDLGYSNFNTDSFKWKARIYDFGSGIFNLQFEKTVQKYHPGVTLLWIGTVSVKVFNFLNENIFSPILVENTSDFVFSLNFYQIFTLVLFSSFLIFTLYLLLVKLMSDLKAFVLILILITEPFLFGLTTTLHLDGILNLFILNCIVSFYLFTQDPRLKSNQKYLYLSAVMFGLSMLTKTTALLVLPGIFLFLGLKYLKNLKQDFLFLLKTFSIFILTSFGTYFVLWPAMWIDPVNTLNYIYKGVTVGTDDHNQIFLGQQLSDPGPLYYVVVFLFKSSIFLVPALIFAIVILLKEYKEKLVKLSVYKFELYLILLTLIYFIEISIPSKKLDRYILTSMIFLSLAVSSILWERYKKLVITFIFINLATMIYLKNDYFSYYNPLFGGMASGIYSFEPKWAFGQKEIQKYFADELIAGGYEVFHDGESIDKIQKDNSKMVVALPEKYYTQLFPYFRQIGSWAVINELKPDAQKAKYFIFPVWENNSYDFEKRYNLERVNSIFVQNTEVFYVYKVKEKNN